MALRALMLRREIERKEAELAALREKDAEFETREADLEVSIAEAATEEENSAVEQAITAFEEERSAHTESVNALEANLRELRERLAAEEAKAPKKPEDKPAEKKNEERSMTMNFSVRDLPMNQRVFEALPEAQRSAILQKDDVQSFLRELRSMKGQTRAISGGELAIPVDFLDLIAENIFRYSKLMKHVRVRQVGGEARQTIAGTVPEAVWTEMCGALNELTFEFNQVTLDGYKVGGFIPVCNALLEDNDVNLASFLIEMISESIGLAKDKAILYGKGAANKMPLGIATRLAQTSKPADWPSNGPAWVDLHTSNIISIDASKTGAAFWADLQVAAGNAFTKYARGEQFWAMNSKTFALLKSKAITFTASGDVVANVYGLLPIVTGAIEILEFMPDGDIIGGFGDLYLWAQRRGMTVGQDGYGFTNRVRDQTVFFGKERADGLPVIGGAFVAINIAGSTPTTSVVFAGDTANTVSGIVLAATATVASGSTLQLAPVLQPYGAHADISYASATTAKATVSSTGLVTGVASGSSVITVTAGGQTATCTVTVTNA